MSEDCKTERWRLLKSQLNNLSPKQLKMELACNPNAVLIDCRRPAEAVHGQLPHSINIDYLAYDFWDKISELDKEQTYFVYCRSGRRSIRTCTLMKNDGFKNIFNLEGGLNAWVQELGSEDLC